MHDGTDGPDAVSGSNHSPDRLLEVLAHRRRRSVIAHLDDEDGRVPLSELARRVAAAEVDDGTDPSQDHCETVAVNLFHKHLPKLAECNVVEFDRDGRTVEPGVNLAPAVAITEELEGVNLANVESSLRVS